jgi:XRE family aerobic/anaerobic benzoate catabolism transcriptional regulator
MSKASRQETSQLLERVGTRVRRLRKKQGLSGKALAEAAGLSPRFIAQLEAGQANIAIGRLEKVALVLGVSLGRLADEPKSDDQALAGLLKRLDGCDPETVRRSIQALELVLGGQGRTAVALVGLRGAGKSTIGPKLAKKMGVPFVELDTEIEAEAGLTLSEIFALHGEGYYRRLEEQCLVHALSQHPTMVVALSGGFVQNGSAWQMVLERCQTVWLEAIPEDHMWRVLVQGDQRPTAGRENAMDELRAILAARAPRYAQSHHRFNTSSLGLEGAVHAICTALH